MIRPSVRRGSQMYKSAQIHRGSQCKVKDCIERCHLTQTAKVIGHNNARKNDLTTILRALILSEQ